MGRVTGCRLNFANLQPSGLVKMFAVLYAADYAVRKINVMHDLKNIRANVWCNGCCRAFAS